MSGRDLIVKNSILLVSSEEESADDDENQDKYGLGLEDDTADSNESDENCEEEDDESSDVYVADSTTSVNYDHPHEDILLPTGVGNDTDNVEDSVLDLPAPLSSLKLYNSQTVANTSGKIDCELVQMVKKISQELPLWENSDPVFWNPIFDPAWRNTKYDTIPHNTDSIPKSGKVGGTNIKLDSEINGRPIGKTYVEEVNRAVYCSTAGHPLFGSHDYFKAAEYYAICGQTFVDITPVKNEKPMPKPMPKPKSKVTPDAAAALNNGSIGNGLHPMPTNRPSCSGLANYHKPLLNAPPTHTHNTFHCRHLKNMAPCNIAATPYRVLVPVQVPIASPNRPSIPPGFSVPTTSSNNQFIHSDLGNVRMPPPGFLYRHPIAPHMCAASHCCNAFPNNCVYDRFVFANMLQNQYAQPQPQQQPQQAASVTSMIQQRSRPRPLLGGQNASSLSLSSLNSEAIPPGSYAPLAVRDRPRAPTTSTTTTVTTGIKRAYSVISKSTEFAPKQASTPSTSTQATDTESTAADD